MCVNNLVHKVKSLVKIFWSHHNVVCWREVFGEVVTQVGETWSPVNKEFFLTNSIFDPVKAHVHSLGTFYFDGGVDVA